MCWFKFKLALAFFELREANESSTLDSVSISSFVKFIISFRSDFNLRNSSFVGSDFNAISTFKIIRNRLILNSNN